MAVAQSIGDRSSQQDDFGCLVAEEFTFVVIADGMGGHQAGEEASELVVEEFLKSVSTLEKGYSLDQYELAKSLAATNDKIARTVEEDGSKLGMGTTVVVLYLENTSMQWLSVGDSHLYRYRGKTLEKLNADHSMMPMIMDLAKSGNIEFSDIESHPLRNTLRSAITGQTIDLIDYPEKPLLIQEGDIYIVCTDGMDVLGTATIESVIRTHKASSPLEVCRQLIESALAVETSDRDNTTLAVIKT